MFTFPQRSHGTPPQPPIPGEDPKDVAYKRSHYDAPPNYGTDSTVNPMGRTPAAITQEGKRQFKVIYIVCTPALSLESVYMYVSA